MRSVHIPNSDLDVSSLCFGTADFGTKIDREAAFQLLDAFVAGGGNFIDTANIYGDWVPGHKSSSEKVIGEWFAQRGNRDQVVIATKGAHPLLSSMNVPRCAPNDIIHDIDQSLGHLQTDVIDLYWLHRDDPTRPTGEIIETLAGQVKAGKIRYFGCSNWRVERIAAANAYAAAHNLPGFVADQPLWNAARLDINNVPDKTLVAMDGALHRYHEQSKMAAIPYSSQANGVLHKWATGRSDAIRPNQNVMYPPVSNQRRALAVQTLANELNVSFTAIVLGYLQSQPFVTVPIIGAQNLPHLQDSLAGDGVFLDEEQLELIDAL